MDYTKWNIPPRENVRLEQLEFVPINEHLARIYHEHFHYIHSFRPGHHYALMDIATHAIAAIGSVAVSDLTVNIFVRDRFPYEEDLWVYTRFYRHDWAPKNTFSYLWSKIRRKIRRQFGAEMVFTFIDPNQGFEGKSHIAAGFSLFAEEHGTEYMFYDGNRMTTRWFVNEFGTNDTARLQEILGERFSIQYPPLPMRVFACPLTKEARGLMSKSPHQIQRPVIIK